MNHLCEFSAFRVVDNPSSHCAECWVVEFYCEMCGKSEDAAMKEMDAVLAREERVWNEL